MIYNEHSQYPLLRGPVGGKVAGWAKLAPMLEALSSIGGSVLDWLIAINATECRNPIDAVHARQQFLKAAQTSPPLIRIEGLMLNAQHLLALFDDLPEFAEMSMGVATIHYDVQPHLKGDHPVLVFRHKDFIAFAAPLVIPDYTHVVIDNP